MLLFGDVIRLPFNSLISIPNIADMKNIIAAIAALLCLGPNAESDAETMFSLDYEQMVLLDAEELAETGINEAYNKLLPVLRQYVNNPAQLSEIIDPDLPRYSVSSAGVIYDIYSPDTSDPEEASWGRATYALFSIINNQLKNSNIRFYAINAGNDLGGMFLTPQQVASAKRTLKRKTDWPYIPTLEYPWYGQFH